MDEVASASVEEQEREEKKQAEEDSDSFECAICLELLCEPLQLPCSHVFCRSCLICDSTREGRCPLCRQQIPEAFDARTARVHEQLERAIKTSLPAEYEERLEQKLSRVLHLRIGNRFKVICTAPRCAYRWTVFVELESTTNNTPELLGKGLDDLVECISFDSVAKCRVFQCGTRMVRDDEVLSPSFNVFHAPFELTATGWVTKATVNITIFWKSWLGQSPTKLQHVPEFVGEEMTDKGWLYSVDLGSAPPTSEEHTSSDPFLSLGSADTHHTQELAPLRRQPRPVRRLSVAAKCRGARRSSVRYMQAILPKRVSKLLSGGAGV